MGREDDRPEAGAPGGLSAVQKEVARAVGPVDDHARIETVFGLKPGTIGEWLDDDEFYDAVNAGIDESLEREGDAPPDYSLGLTSLQQKYAQLLVYEGLTQKDAAKRVAKSVRTARDWDKEWIFRRYKRQLEKEVYREFAERYNATTREVQIVLHEGALIAAKGLSESAQQGNVQAQVALLKPWLKRRP